MNYADKYQREKKYQYEYRRRPEILKRERERRKRLRQDATYREEYNKATNARRRKARDYIRNRVRTGKLTREPCVFCGKRDGLAHHEDYSKPLDIVWVCHTHHAQIHGGSLQIQQKHISHVAG